MRKIIIFSTVFLFVFSCIFNVNPASSNIDIPASNIIQISKGEMKTINLRTFPERLDIGTRGIVDTFMQDRKTLIIKGIAKGFTSLFVLYEDGKIDQYGITVSEGTSALINGLAEQMRVNLAPIKTINIEPAGDKIIVSGTIEDEKYLEYYKKIVSLYADYIVNMVRDKTTQAVIEVEKQVIQKPETKAESIDIVQIDVKVVQIRDTDNLDLGIRWFPQNQPWTITGASNNSYQSQRQKTTTRNTQGSDNYSSSKTKTGNYINGDPNWDNGAWSRTDTVSNTSLLSKTVPDVLTRTLLYSPSINVANVNLELIALAEEGKVKMLATPKLIVQSGKTASFLVGGEIPIAQSTGFVSSVDWKKYGTTLEISPEVVNTGSIFISLKATLSELDYSHMVGDYPSLITKEAETRLTAKDGETFAIAGLISQDYTDTIDKVPLLGDIPILGYLFKSKTKTLTNVETVMIFTPHIIKADREIATYGEPAGIYPSTDLQNYIIETSGKKNKTEKAAVPPAAVPSDTQKDTGAKSNIKKRR